MSTLTSLLARRLDIAGNSRTGVFIAVAGVAAAVTVMLLTIGISLGFNHGIKTKLIGFQPALSVSAPYSYVTGRLNEYLTVDADLKDAIHSVVPEGTLTLSLRQPAILKTADDFATVVLRGYSADYDTTFLASNLVEGRLPKFGTPEADTTLVISRQIADMLDLHVGDRVNTCFFVRDAIKARRLTITGLYDSGFGDMDRQIAYSSLAMLQDVGDVGPQTGTIIEINTPGDIDRKANMDAGRNLQQTLADRAIALGHETIELVDCISNTGAVYLNWLDLIDTNVVVIIALMSLVAALTLISSLFIIILDHVTTIGILRALGANGAQIRGVFRSIALRLVLMGVVIGDVIGLGLGWIQQTFHPVSLDPEMYYLTSVPYSFDLLAVLAVNIGVLVLAWLVLMLPARLASRLSPARTMRYE